MAITTVLSVWALLLISNVQQTKAGDEIFISNAGVASVREGSLSVPFVLRRVGSSNDRISVVVNVTDVTTGPEDTRGPRSRTLTLLPNQRAIYYQVYIVDDMVPEETERFQVTITGDAVVSPSQVFGFITDNDFYSTWIEWSAGECSVTCGSGNNTETRTRNCIAVNYANCVQPLNESRSVACTPGACPIITQWSEWTDNGTCSTACGSGSQMQSRSRNCTGTCPADLTLADARTIMCSICACQVTSEWTEWADDGTCSTTCGPGTKEQSRRRSCTPATCCPTDFTSRETRTVDCEICTCPVIGAWCPWANSGECSVTCGDGTKTQTRSRECTDTCTPYGCVKDEERTVTCNSRPCPWSRLSGSRRSNRNKPRRGWRRKGWKRRGWRLRRLSRRWPSGYGG